MGWGRKHCEKGEIACNKQFLHSHNVFHSYISLLCQNAALCGNELNNIEVLNPSPKKPWFLHVCGTSRLKTLWEKEKLLATSNFYFSYSVFLPFKKTFCHFYQI